MTRKSVESPINWNIEKNTTINTEGLKEEVKEIENHIDLPFYLPFPTGIYLFKINNINRKTLFEICPKLTRKVPDQMCKTKFLQMCSFSIILTSLHSLNLSFPLLFYVISTAIPKFPFWLSTSPPWFPKLFVFPPRFSASPSHSSQSHPYSPHFPHSVPQFPISVFTDNLLRL